MGTKVQGDALEKLREYCADHEMPTPTMEVERGFPLFLVRCAVSSIDCIGSSLNDEQEASCRAASKMLAIISMNNDNGDASSAQQTNANSISDRSNMFKDYPRAFKVAALEVIIRSDKYTTIKEQALSLLAALKLTPKMVIMPAVSEDDEELISIDLDCGFEIFFLGPESNIYDRVIKYFTFKLI